MKAIKSYLCVLFFTLPFFVSAQEFSTVVEVVKKAKDTPELIQVRNQLERFGIVHPEEWLANYYLAYVDVQLSFRVSAKEEKQRYLADADTYLNKLPDLTGIDLSEVLTLKGYRLYGLIASDPGTNGPLYYGEITSYYEKALGLNPNNPRAIILSALFKNDMARFMQQAYPDFQKDVDKATTLFAAEDPATIAPTWGRFWVDFATAKK